MHASLEELLSYEAFKVLRMPLLPYRVDCASPLDVGGTERWRAEVVRSMAEEAGFRRALPTSRCGLYERGDAALLLYQYPMAPAFSFTLGGEDPKEVARLAQDFEARTGCTISS
ncbi:hypothetical protein JY572_28050 [Myxococcus landrumensis]|uniref:Uncharacterized protein n=1 Tax=Myxococcus landrumensis TaxID=2813577 RepID=A0ABX7NLT0_9BACT|nr:hypothetical protein JY572_28050 [Myxococcus landrumus]